MLLEEARSYAVIASITMAVTVDGLQNPQQRKTAWITAYELYANSKPIRNPLTGAKLFKGNSRALSQKFNAFWPQFTQKLRLVPKSWFNAIALRWQLVFASRKSPHPPLACTI